jgi:hypothetical protein
MESESIATLILKLGTRWRKWSASHPSHFTLRKRAHFVHWIGRWAAESIETFRRSEKSLNLPENKLQFLCFPSCWLVTLPAELPQLSCASTYVCLRAYVCMETVVSTDNGYFSDVGGYAIWRASFYTLTSESWKCSDSC